MAIKLGFCDFFQYPPQCSILTKCLLTSTPRPAGVSSYKNYIWSLKWFFHLNSRGGKILIWKSHLPFSSHHLVLPFPFPLPALLFSSSYSFSSFPFSFFLLVFVLVLLPSSLSLSSFDSFVVCLSVFIHMMYDSLWFGQSIGLQGIYTRSSGFG